MNRFIKMLKGNENFCTFVHDCKESFYCQEVAFNYGYKWPVSEKLRKHIYNCYLIFTTETKEITYSFFSSDKFKETKLKTILKSE